MAVWLDSAGHDALHTLDLPDANRTTDMQVIERADADHRVVVTKDADFVNEHMLHGRPAKLLLISTGNATNRELETIFAPVIPSIVREFEVNAFIELSRTGLVIRG